MVFFYPFIKSRYVRFIISALLGASFIALVYTTDINFLYKRLAAAQKRNSAIKKQVQAVQEKLKLLQTLSTEQKAEKTAQPISELEVISILNILEKEMVASQVVAILFEPATIQQNENFMIYPVKLELNGSYKNLLAFVNKALQLPYLVVVEDLTLQKKKDEDMESADDLQMQILLMVYKSKYATTEKTRSLSIPFSSRDVFKPEVSRKGLYLWSNKELQFLGLIKQTGAVFGVIGDPLGSIYRVSVGDKVGLNQSVITAINECGVTMAKKTDNIYRGGRCP